MKSALLFIKARQSVLVGNSYYSPKQPCDSLKQGTYIKLKKKLLYLCAQQKGEKMVVWLKEQHQILILLGFLR